MVRQPVDRTLESGGINRTLRDSRAPHNVARKLENIYLPDGRIDRRLGFELYNDRRIKGSQIMRQTPAVVDTGNTSSYTDKEEVFKTPLSYGLLRWHDDFQPYTTRDWTVEFVLTLGDVESLITNPFLRVSFNDYGGTPDKSALRGSGGVFVYDQSILSNYHNYQHDGATEVLDPTDIAGQTDTFALTAMAVSYSSTLLTVHFTMWDTANLAYDDDTHQLTANIGGYGTGDNIHVAITHDTATSTLRLLIDGQPSVDSHVYTSGNDFFAGEVDRINGASSDTPIQRDIVLLNEFIVRAGYASACKPHKTSTTVAADGNQQFKHYPSDAAQASNRPAPWTLAPGKGTGLSELRIWHERRLQTDIDTFKHVRLDPENLPANIVGYWPMNDGGLICFDHTANGRDISLHHNYPAYVRDTGLITGTGLRIADGQHVKKEYTLDAGFYGEDSYSALNQVFEHDVTLAADNYSSKHDFTVQMQIRTPYTFQQEVNRVAGSAQIDCGNGGAVGDTRDSMEVNPFAMVSGYSDDDWTSNPLLPFMRDENGTAIATANMRYFRAFDSTLWSVEAQAQTNEEAVVPSDILSNGADRVRIPLARGALTPGGEVAFEFFGYDGTNLTGREFRITSSQTLAESTVYTLTFVKRTLYYLSGTPEKPTPHAFQIEIYIDGVLDQQLSIGSTQTGSVPDIVDVDVTSQSCRHGGLRDIVVGATKVNDGYDRSIRAPVADGQGTVLEKNTATGRFMSPYEDQPGFFTLGAFRLWTTALPIEDIGRFNFGVSDEDKTASLVFNVEPMDSAGDVIKNDTDYSAVFKLGFKGWGIPSAMGFEGAVGGSTIDGRKAIQSTWSMEDCIGYGEQPTLIGNDAFENLDKDADCQGIEFYGNTLSQAYGILAQFDNVSYVDELVNGFFKQIYLPHIGIMSEFSKDSTWRGTGIGDRTVLTAFGAIPKVYDGVGINPLGFLRGSIPIPLVTNVSAAGGTYTNDLWYGFRIVYYAESIGLYDISPVSIQKTQSSGSPDISFVISNIAAHPDPRVTSIQIAVTEGQPNVNTALTAPLSFVPEGPIPNKYTASFTTLTPPGATSSPLLLDVTAAPICTYSASYGGRLWLTGNDLIKDAVFFSDAGNPERFDTLTNRLVLEESSGDRPNGIVSMFGALFVFKPNSIWRITEVAVGQFEVIQVASIGPASENAIVKVVIPDSGREAVVMWTIQGPYLYDGVKLQYIGGPVEDLNNYGWLEHKSVFIVHNIQERELHFFYREIIDGEAVDRHAKSVVFNYRRGVWYENTGLVGRTSLSLNISTSDQSFVDDSPSGYSSAPVGVINDRYLSLIGGNNGRIYNWGVGLYDGLFGDQSAGPFVITGYSANEVFLEGDPLDQDNLLRGLWVTVIREDGADWFIMPVKSHTSNAIVLDTDYSAVPFMPSIEDSLYVGNPPLHIEYPWDVLEQPYFDKQLHRLTTWHRGEWRYKVDSNWDVSSITKWRKLLDGEGKRRHTELNRTLEAAKLQLVSFDVNAKLDAYMYQVGFDKDAVLKQ